MKDFVYLMILHVSLLTMYVCGEKRTTIWYVPVMLFALEFIRLKFIR